MLLKRLFRVSILAASIAAAFPAQAITIKDAAQEAVLRNPEVLNRWHVFKSASEQIESARSGYWPTIDASAGISRHWRRYDDAGRADRDYTSRGLGLYLREMLYDGFFTRSEVERFSYAQRLRYFELLDASEGAALEASRAYNDVLRYRKLYKLSQDNYVQHRVVFEQMQERVKSNVGRRVDLEQASGRLALAEANLLTEASNLHDVSSRYQRIVGTLPPAEMAEPTVLKDGIPGTANEAIVAAYQTNPSLAAAQENIMAAAGAVKSVRSRFHPHLFFEAGRDIVWDDEFSDGKSTHDFVGLVLNYNFYKGGGDKADERRYLHDVDAAKDLRDKACRDIRQRVAIAHNEMRRLEEQLNYLDQHQLATEKARDAYRLQFNVGQRTLLDLLDTENELFEARRSYVAALHDYAQAHSEAQAAMGTLLAALGLQRLETPELAEADEKPEFDPNTVCPPEDVGRFALDKDKLYAEAIAANPELLRQPMIEDGDGDGVADARDRCPDTPVGATVGPDGCTLVGAPMPAK
jgi:adhesin transport system outer membrane protein